jgi:nitrogenase molybdenum-iron protein beta chain
MEVSRITGKPIPEELAQGARPAGRRHRDSARTSTARSSRSTAIPICASAWRASCWNSAPSRPTCWPPTAARPGQEKVQALLDSSPFGKNCHVYPGKDLWHMRSLLFTEPVDFLIGNTYGKYLERDTGTPLIRIGFPIFDRHHHHRYPVWGYQGG